MPPLSTAQLDFYWEQGYLVVGPLLSPERVDRLRRALDSLWERWAGELGVTPEAYCRVVSQWTNLWESDPAFAEQLRHPECTAMAAELIGCERVRVFHDHVISKPPGLSGAVPWHQDYPYWPLKAPRALSLWLALDDATPESGCMHFMPGAHREGECPAVDFLNDRKEWGARLERIRPVPVPAGWGIFHNCLSWHTTPANTSAGPRRAYISIYMDAHVAYAPGHSGWHPMNARVTAEPGELFNDDKFPIVGGVA
ncbi:MAG: phytanoyl-CoA dioxygenase family protein [Myxococcales bacterium]|nr:phytanoyl-CoA dioxygenase family protein [Myxococcales bacterium]